MAQPQVLSPTCMESINRITRLPAVNSSIQGATNIYGKIKEYNGVTQWTCSTAESVVQKAVEVGKPLAQSLETPIKTVDGYLCNGLDYVEEKVPVVKLPPQEMVSQIYTSTKDYVSNTVTPAVESAYSYVEPVVKKMEPAYETAKTVIEPAVELAKELIDPYVQPCLDKVQLLKEFGVQKLEEYLHGHNHQDGVQECEECQQAARNMEQSDGTNL